jgi:hypothetical protein
MRFAVAAAVLALAVVSALVVYLVFSNDSGGGAATVIAPSTPTPVVATPTPLPSTWLAGVRPPTGGEAMLISCLDANHDGRLDSADGPQLAGLDIALVKGEGCVDPAHNGDFYAGPPSDPASFSCDAPHPPLLVVAVASAGSNLLDASGGESIGLLDIVNEVRRRSAEAGVGTQLVLATSAIFGAEPAQTSMEHWMAHYVAGRLATMPCLRAVMIGHSHGGVNVTSVTAALDDRYADRLFGVMIDRTTALYDRNATEFPSRVPLLNIYQLNEGWHGQKLNLPNVVNADESAERAPIAPSEGGGGIALVSHKTLDDAPAVQRRVEDAVMAWAIRPGR